MKILLLLGDFRLQVRYAFIFGEKLKCWIL